MCGANLQENTQRIITQNDYNLLNDSMMIAMTILLQGLLIKDLLFLWNLFPTLQKISFKICPRRVVRKSKRQLPIVFGSITWLVGTFLSSFKLLLWPQQLLRGVRFKQNKKAEANHTHRTQPYKASCPPKRASLLSNQVEVLTGISSGTLLFVE